MEKSYKFRIYPNKEQTVLIEKTFGCSRFVYNEALAARIEAYKSSGTTISKFDMINRLPALKAANPWLKEVDSQALVASVERLDTAYQNFFRGCKTGEKVGFPKFKSKKRSRAAYRAKYINNNIQVSDRAIKLPKMDWIKCRVSTEVQGRILSATVSRAPSGKYFVSICCTDVSITPMASTGAAVGLDYDFKAITTSDGDTYKPSRFYQDSEQKLAKLQRALSRKSRGSNRYEKNRIKLARLHERITNQRTDDLHKLTTSLVRNYDIICVRDLDIMSLEQNPSLAKTVTDAAWGELVRQLEYKCKWYGKTLVRVKYDSDCGTKYDGNSVAENILKEGLQSLAAA